MATFAVSTKAPIISPDFSKEEDSELELLVRSFSESKLMEVALCDSGKSPLVGNTGAKYRFKVTYLDNKRLDSRRCIIGWHGTSIENVIKIVNEGGFNFNCSRDMNKPLGQGTIYIANARLLQYEKQSPDHILKNLRIQLIVQLDTSNLRALGYPGVIWSPLRELHCSQQSFGKRVPYRIREILIWKV